MSRYAINKCADELGVSHAVALLVWELTDEPDEFRAMLEDYAAGRGLVLCS